MTTSKKFDAIVVGGGIAGASVAAFLADDGVKIALLERENSLAYHTTGRSAALYTPYYGPDSMRAFGALSRNFLESPTFDSEVRILSDRKTLSLVDTDEVTTVERPPHSIWLDEKECLDRIPFLRSGKYVGGVLDTQVASIDVHALHSLYIKVLTQCGGNVLTGAEVTKAELRADNTWAVEANGESLFSPVLINAAGAWGDELANRCGVGPVGLVPKRRTVVVINEDQFNSVSFDELPFVIVEPNYLYFQQFGIGQLMMSPADKTPIVPCDVQPDELDKAITVARFESVSTLKVNRIDHSWAGLRTFTQDEEPVIGWDNEHPGFFWLVGQGGYGVFTSPAIGRYAASLVSGSNLSKEYLTCRFPFERLSPDRFRLT